MPQFQFTPYHSPFANSIAETIARRGDIAARAAEQVGAAQAGAQQASGQAWARGIEGAGQAVSGAIQQATDPRRQMEQIQLDRAKQTQQGERTVDTMMRGDQMAPGDTGPRQESYLDANGLFDIGKMTQALGSSGIGHLAPDLLKGAEQINESVLKRKAIDQQIAEHDTLQAGDLAAGALKLSGLGMPLITAMDFVVQPALANKTLKPDQYAQIKAQISSLPPERQAAALTTFMDAAAKLAPTKNLGEGVTETDRYGRVIAKGGAKPPNETEVAIKAAQGDPEAIKAMAILKPGPKRTEAEQALDAFAVSLGKKDATQLTDADRQTFVKRDAQQKADVAFGQHQRERQYDVAHPVPVKGKSQDELEQEARGVLQREFSSRSGGLGMEDQKVNQAVHLLTLMNQFDGKPMPAQIHGELALGLARLTSPNGQVGIELEREFKQKTAVEGLSKAVAYLTGDPTLVNATPEKLREMLRDSITRQGHVAEENRQTYLNAMLSMLPTQLETPRREALSKSVELNKVDTVKMRAPNGQIQDVLRKDIEHYKARGAKVIGG